MSESIRNPLTGRNIKIGGPTHKRLIREGVLMEGGENETVFKKKKAIIDDNLLISDSESEGEYESEEEYLDEDDEDQKDVELEEDINDDIEEEEDPVVDDMLVNVVDVACTVVSNNFNKLRNLDFNKRKRVLKSLITKGLT